MNVKILFLVALSFSISVVLRSQILFGDLGIKGPADSSASVEIRSINKGFLPPVMSSLQRKAIKNPAAGLIVFDSTKQQFYGFIKGAGWRPFLMGYDSAVISEVSTVTVTDNSLSDQLGYAVAINGDIALATAPADDINGKVDQGSLYVFKRVNGVWSNTQKVIAPDGEANDFFGNAVVMTDKFVFVSALNDDIGENINQGSVYVFKIDAGTVVFQQKLTGSTSTSNDVFGYSLAVQKNQLFVGAPYDDIGVNTDQGSVYSFKMSEGVWGETQKIIQDSLSQTEDYFGFGMSIDSDLVSIGGHFNTTNNYGYGQNAVFIYENVNGTWQRRQKILQPNVAPGYKNDAFGFSTSLKNGILTVGAWLHNIPEGNKDRGAMYVFKKEGTNWNYTQKVSPVDVNIGDPYGDYFGYDMSQFENYLISGNGYEDIAGGNIDRGAFYLLNWDGSQWVIVKKVALPSPNYLDFFGHAVGMHSGNMIIGAYMANNAQGKVYFYSISD